MSQFDKSLILFVIIALLVFSSFRRKLKDDQPRRRYGSIALGIGFITWGIVAMVRAHITAGHHYPHIYFAHIEPGGFWLVVSGVILLGLGCVFRGIRGGS